MNRNDSAIPLGRVFGVPVSLDWSWFLIFGLLTWSLANGYFPARYPYWSDVLTWALSAGAAVLLFVSVLLHEFGHALTAMAFHIPVRRIRLMIFGGVAELGDESPHATSEFLVAIAGPAVSFLLAGVLGVAWALLRYTEYGSLTSLEPVLALSGYLARLNLMLAIFNLIPGFPLDGGRVLRSVVWFVTGSLGTATRIAGTVGRIVGYGFIGVGAYLALTGGLTNGLWIAFIGLFLQGAASREMKAQQIREWLNGQTVSKLISSNFAILPAEFTLQRLLDAGIMGRGWRSYIIADNGQPVGVLQREKIRAVPMHEWRHTDLNSVMTALDVDRPITPGMGLWTALQRLELARVPFLPVVQNGMVQGVIRREDVLQYLHNIRTFGADPVRL